MSSIVLLKQNDAVHAVTDGATYSAAGTLIAVLPKVMTIPHLNAAIYTRGPAYQSWNLGIEIASSCRDFDTAKRELQSIAPGYFIKNEEALRVTGYPDLEVFFFGWAEGAAVPSAWYMRCGFPDSEFHSDTAKPGYRPEPFKFVEVGKFVASPGVERKNMIAAGFPVEVAAEDLIPEIDLLHMIEMQRHFPSPLSMRTQFKDRNQANVGGYAQLTSIYADRIEQRILAQWNDRVGSPIMPGEMDWKQWRNVHPRTNSISTSYVPTGADVPPASAEAGPAAAVPRHPFPQR